MTTAIDVIAHVNAGDADDDLDSVLHAIQNRRQFISRQRVLGLKSGDKVRFSQTSRPQYLRGLYATFVRHLRDRVVVTIDEQDPTGEPQDTGRFSGEVRCPPELIEVL
jgi:hypothetical protein